MTLWLHLLVAQRFRPAPIPSGERGIFLFVLCVSRGRHGMRGRDL